MLAAVLVVGPIALASHHYCTHCVTGCNNGPLSGGGGTWHHKDTYRSGLVVEWWRTWYPHNECRGLGTGCDDSGTSLCYEYQQRIGTGSIVTDDQYTNIC